MHVFAHFQHRLHAMSAIARRILKIAADVSTGAEAAAGSGKNHGANFVIVTGVAESCQNLVDHDLGISIELLRTIEGHGGDMTALGIQNLFEFFHRPVNFGARFSRNARTPSL